MEFCKKCGSSRTIIDSKKEIITCQKCGYIQKIEGDLYKKKVNPKNNSQMVVLSKEYLENKYKTTHKCPHCGNNEAYARHIPPRWGDEDQLTIYTCTKCGKSDREGFSY